MYIQILTECNMSCSHCIMSCARGKKGEYMSRETYARSIELSQHYGDMIVIGGGEPTMHKEFFDFLDFAMWKDIENTLVVTNGGFTNKAFKLLDYLDRYDSEKLTINLSQDIYHDKIDERVVEAYERRNLIRTCEPEQVIYMGSAVENQIYNPHKAVGCNCETLFVKPNGDLKICGCEDAATLGNVNTMTDSEYDNLMDFYFAYRDEHGGEPCHAHIEQEHYDEMKQTIQPVRMAA
ncbi:radical SAM protein [Vibrio crassostreae]|uniref:radical SAM protein n=1 Tax=Vibrio crassostreae TaxID=246167 RepID=UPI001B30D636|nr:radical SAM protein [Vibrio crassostreae]